MVLLQVLWSDIDYMDRNRIFSFDPINYPVAKLAAFVARWVGDSPAWEARGLEVWEYARLLSLVHPCICIFGLINYQWLRSMRSRPG